jgi:hypothetical protein
MDFTILVHNATFQMGIDKPPGVVLLGQSNHLICKPNSVRSEFAEMAHPKKLILWVTGRKQGAF